MNQLISSFAIMLCFYVVLTVGFCMWAQVAGNSEEGQQRIKSVGAVLIILYVITAVGLNVGFATHGMNAQKAESVQLHKPERLPMDAAEENNFIVVALREEYTKEMEELLEVRTYRAD